MAIPWFRVWGDMVNDPKWRTIARVSGQKIGDVIATYVHMMTLASNATERGRTQGWNDEDIGTALDINTDQVAAIREAMQGRVLDGDYLTGWEKRQPIKEDGAAERAKAWREAQKALKQTQTNAPKRERTPEEIREDKKREEGKQKQTAAAELLESQFEIAWSAYPPRTGASKSDSFKKWKARIADGVSHEEILAGVMRYAAYVGAKQTEDSYIKQPVTFFGPGKHYAANWSVPSNFPAPAAASRHSGFDKKDYSEGVGADGSIN